MISVRSLTLAFTLSVLFKGTSAVPLPRQDGNSNPAALPIGDFMTASITKFLESQNVDAKSFIPINGSINIDWIKPDGSVDQYAENKKVFETANTIRSSGSPASPLSFSDMYIDFIKEIHNATDPDNSTQSELSASSAASHQACMTDLQNVTTEALSDYKAFTGQQGNTTDSAFIQWAQTNDDVYNTARINCQNARNKYLTDVSSLAGDNFALFSSAYESIRPLTDSDGADTPGITMDIVPPANGTSVGQALFKPLIQMTELDGLMKTWMAETDAQYTFDSSQDHTSDITKSSGGSGGFGIEWDGWSAGADASHQETEHTYNMTATAFSISYVGFELLDISYGAWFDDYRVAEVVNNATDDKTKLAKPAFNKYFGSGINDAMAAAKFNKKALVGYKPQFSMTFQNENDFNKVTDTQASASVCFLIFCIGGSHNNQQNVTISDSGAKTITYGDESGHILGLVEASFWDSQSL